MGRIGRIVAPLAGWNVRGYSYGELQPNGEHHPGADLNVGYGDDDLGLPVVCFADGVVAERLEWDGRPHGFGNAALVEHRLFGDGAGDGGVRVWSLYAHLDGFADSLIEGREIAAGEEIGRCGKSGGQTWAHVHFELRYKGPPEMTASYWGGRLNYEAQSARFADPYTLLRVLEGVEMEGADSGEELRQRLDEAQAEMAAVRADREFNYRLKMEMEGFIRGIEGRRLRVKPGTADGLIAYALSS